jgi:hypothetical protein
VRTHFGYPYSRLRRLLDSHLERRWLSAATRVTTATEGLLEVLRASGYAHLPMECVPNGYFDPPAPAPLASRADAVLRLCHTGTLHERGGHTVAPLLEAIGQLPEASAVEAIFYGAVNTDFALQATRRGLTGSVRFGGRLTREDAQRQQQEADVLVVLLPDTPEQRVSLPSKTFDYLAARRAILAIVPLEGENAALLRRVGVTHIYAPSDVRGIARCLSEMAETKRRTGTVPPEADPEAVAAYHYRHLARQLARVLDAAVGTP